MNFCRQGLAFYIVECEPLIAIFMYITGFMRASRIYYIVMGIP